MGARRFFVFAAGGLILVILKTHSLPLVFLAVFFLTLDEIVYALPANFL